jgi:hypothetical protein
MSEHIQVATQCPRCGSQMIQGSLKGPVETIHIESVQSLEDSPLQALICCACGHVELQATCPDRLAHHDISDEELDCFSARF